jgi:RNA polymerase sigma-70 factor (ECF subfamily)
VLNSKPLGDLLVGCSLNHSPDQELVYRHYYAYCLKIVFRYSRSYEQAVNVVNDGFVKAFLHMNQFQHPKGADLEQFFMGWLRRIMINTAIDQLRKERNVPRIIYLEPDLYIEDEKRSADQPLLYKELIYEIKKLPPSYRAVFNMYVIDGYNHQEISSILGISEGTSKSNLFRARELLKQIIANNEKYYKECNG